MNAQNYQDQALNAAKSSIASAKEAAADELQNLKEQGAAAQAVAQAKAQEIKDQAQVKIDELQAKVDQLQVENAAQIDAEKSKAEGIFDKLKDKTADLLHAGADKMSDLAEKLQK